MVVPPAVPQAPAITQVYHRRQNSVRGLAKHDSVPGPVLSNRFAALDTLEPDSVSPPASDISLVAPSPPSTSDPVVELPPPPPPPVTSLAPLDIPIALRKAPRSTANPHYRSHLSYSALSPTYSAFVSALDGYQVPRNVSEALANPGWCRAMQEEMDALRTSGTWDLVRLPPGKRCVGCKWVWTVKLNPDGSLSRLKARLVAKGYTQTQGIDYEETFSPVCKMTSVRLLVSLAARHKWPLYQLDVKNAFLNGVLEEEVYMEQPPGFEVQEESGKVCRLRKSLYGLKQSPRAWFARFSQAVQRFGMRQSMEDPSVFFRHQSGRRILMVVYVDDIVITGDDTVGMQALKSFIGKEFQTKDLGQLKYFLGIEVARSDKGVCMTQRRYVLDILAETGLLDCRSVAAPMDPNSKLRPDEGSLMKDPGRYRRLVEKLNYLTVTRPDISYPVSVVSQFMSAPRTNHWEAVIRILRYLKGSPGRGLIYSDGGHCRVAGFSDGYRGRIAAFSDADWAGCPTTRRSTTGYAVFVGGNLVSWKSRKQHTVSRSSTEAEYRAMADVTCEMMWIRRLLVELGVEQKGLMNLYCDNQSAIHIGTKEVFHERTKHIEVDCHVVREALVGTMTKPKIMQAHHVRTDIQLADMLTKPLAPARMDFIVDKLGMYDMYQPNLRRSVSERD